MSAAVPGALPLPQRLNEAARTLSGAPLSFADLAVLHGEGGHGSLLILLALPCLLPVPGVGNVMGAALVLLSWVHWRGGDTRALPPAVAQLRLSSGWARRVLVLMARFYTWMERWSRTRLPWMVSRTNAGWLCAKVAVMGLIIFLPLPLGNVLPALALLLLGAGLALRDGLAVGLSLLVAALALVYTTAIGLTAWSALSSLHRGLEALGPWWGWS
jgi:hypothetical protein